jgi:hypothetical protein
MPVVKGNFSALQKKTPARPQDVADQIMADIGLDNVVIISQNDRGGGVVAYFNEYEGRRYFHIRTFYTKYGKFLPGKGMTCDPAIAKEVCTQLGELAPKL